MRILEFEEGQAVLSKALGEQGDLEGTCRTCVSQSGGGLKQKCVGSEGNNSFMC